MKHDNIATATATAATVAVVYVVCRLAFLWFPDLSLVVAQSWFHGVSISTTDAVIVTTNSFILGLLTATGGSWLVGYIFAWTYNLFAKK